MPSSEYEGLPVRKHSVAVRGASGDALNGSLKVAPRDFHPGERAFMVLEVTPEDVNHKPMDEGEAWNRVQVVKVARGCFVDEGVALPYLADVAVKLEDLRVKETGQERLPLEEDPMVQAHEQGKHKQKRQACPLCNPKTDEDIARVDELAAKREAHGDGEGDADNPLPAAKRYRGKPRTPKK